jgi:tetratricopeptide (TPR) repeat protein
LELAAFYLQKEDTRQTFDVLAKGEPLLVQSPLYYQLRARAHLLAEDAANAVADARRANELDLTLLDGYRLLAEALQANQDYLASLKPLQTYIQYAPDDPQALTMLGQASMAAGEQDRALAAFDRVLAIDKSYLAVYLARGAIYLEQGEGQKALDDFESVLRLKSGSFEANLGKGRALLLLGYNGDAYMQISRSQGFARGEAEQAQVHYWRALALEKLKERDPNSGVAAINDWKALLALPAGSYPSEWARQAEEHIQALYTSTPTPRPTLTPSATATSIPTRTATATVTPTPQPTGTLTATPTGKP